MSFSNKIYDFPSIPVKSQVFHVPGGAIEGGFTSGGARVMSPEPSGRATLEIQLAYQTNEHNSPFVSWLMSKTNGQIFRVQLTKTPQLVTSFDTELLSTVPWEATGLFPASTWDNDENWLADGLGVAAFTNALQGSVILIVDMLDYGEILKVGHVIGAGDCSHIVDEISYAEGIATIIVNPPLRNNIDTGDIIYFRPYFIGTISNGEELKSTYDSYNVGGIQPGRIVFREVII